MLRYSKIINWFKKNLNKVKVYSQKFHNAQPNHFTFYYRLIAIYPFLKVYKCSLHSFSDLFFLKLTELDVESYMISQ